MTIKIKVEKELPDFVGEVIGMSVEELDKKLASLAKHYEEVTTAQNNDEKYQEAKKEVKEMGAPYRDVKKAIRMKNSYIVELIKEKGGK